MNALLVDGLRRQLARAGIDVLEAQAAPPNDGGLALGQAWVARRHCLAAKSATEPRDLNMTTTKRSNPDVSCHPRADR